MSPACAICHPAQLAQLLEQRPALAQAWQALPRLTLPANAPVQALGQPCRQAWWISRGLVRCLYLSADGQARNRSFHAEGAWVSGSLPPLAPEAPPAPALFAIETLEPTELVELPYRQLTPWQHNWPELTGWLAEAVASVFSRQAEREAALLGLSPQARYEQFLRDEPTLAARVPLHQVASYLGISQVSLSRMRARMGVSGLGRLA